MPDNPRVTASYKTLLNYARKGLDQYIPDGTDKAYPVRDLLGLIQPDGRDDGEKIIEILQRIEGLMADKQSFVESFNRVVDLKPNVMGFGVNLNEVLERLEKLWDSRRSSDDK
jgi:hypothetical protein